MAGNNTVQLSIHSSSPWIEGIATENIRPGTLLGYSSVAPDYTKIEFFLTDSDPGVPIIAVENGITVNWIGTYYPGDVVTARYLRRGDVFLAWHFYPDTIYPGYFLRYHSAGSVIQFAGTHELAERAVAKTLDASTTTTTTNRIRAEVV